MKHIVTTFSLLMVLSGAIAQNSKEADYYAQIKNFNLSRLWHADSLHMQGTGYTIAFPEPLGFIGDKYQRFYIHYTSVTRDSKNPYRYIVHGKTRVKDDICPFTGTITILKAALSASDEPGYKQGDVTCEVDFKEDSKFTESGQIKGRLITSFYINKKGQLLYDTLDTVSDSYCNNQCEAVWTDYVTNKSKKCNWGDFRIPDSGGLDSGAGEFRVSPQYQKNGWQNYAKAFSDNTDEAKAALKEESRKWWK